MICANLCGTTWKRRVRPISDFMPSKSSSTTTGWTLRRNMDSTTTPELHLLVFSIGLFSMSFLTLLKRCSFRSLCGNRNNFILLLVLSLTSLESVIAMQKNLRFWTAAWPLPKQKDRKLCGIYAILLYRQSRDSEARNVSILTSDHPRRQLYTTE